MLARNSKPLSNYSLIPNLKSMELLIAPQNHNSWYAYGLIGFGLILRYLISRRRFNRRGIAGLQLFSSYEKWWFVTRIEAIFYFLGLLSIVAGILLYLFK